MEKFSATKIIQRHFYAYARGRSKNRLSSMQIRSLTHM